MAICVKQGANDLHMVQLMPLPPHHLCFRKSWNGLSLWYQLTQVVQEKVVKRVVLLLLQLAEQGLIQYAGQD